MAGNYQTADEWLKQKYGSAGAAATKQSGNYQTAEEWLEQRQQGNSTTSNEQIHQAAMSMSWARRYNKLQNRISEGSFSWDDAVEEVNSLIRGYNGGNGIRGALDEESIQDFDGAYQNLLDIKNRINHYKSGEEYEKLASFRAQAEANGAWPDSMETWDLKNAKEIADDAEKAYQDYLHSKEYSQWQLGRQKDQENLNRFVAESGIPIGLPAFYEKNEKEVALKKKAEQLRAIANQYQMEDLLDGIDSKAEQAEQEYQDYIHSEEYAAWQLGRQQAQENLNRFVSESGIPIGLPASYEKNEKEDELKRKASYYRNLANRKKDEELIQADMKELESWPEEDQQALKRYMTGRTVDFYDTMNVNQNGIRLGNAEREAAGLFQKYGKQRVDEIAESYSRVLSRQNALDTTQQAQNNAGKGFWSDVGQSIGSVGLNLMGSVNGVAGYANELAQSTGRFSTLDPYNMGNIASTYAGAVRGQIAENLEEKYGAVGSTLYQAGMSALDNLARIATVGDVGSLALAATGSFSQAVSEYSKKGATPVEALTMGVISGGLEVLTEKVSLDRLLKDFGSGKKSVTRILKDMLIQGGIEVSEEEASLLGTILAEAVILQERSSFNQEIEELQVYGMTKEEAREKACWDVVEEAAQTAIQSFLSGGMMSGATSVYSNTLVRMQERAEQKQLKKTVQQAAQEIQNGQKSGSASVTVPEGVTVAAEKVQQAERISRATGRQIEFYSKDGTAAVDKTGEKAVPVDKEALAPERRNTILPTVEESPAVENHEATEPVTLESLSQKYGDQAKAMQANYMEGQDVEEYDRAFQMAYDMGKAGVNAEYVRKSEATSYLSESQREIAYQIGVDAANASAKAQSEKNAAAANGKTGWRKGTVRGENVKLADLVQTFNDPQRKAYKALCTIAEATGIDIVLFKSQENDSGEFEGEQGRFKWKDNTIYIDVNSGLSYAKDAQSVSKYAMLRTFGHEFTHFIEKWNPEQYNEFRKVVFQTMENPAELIETKLSQDSTGKMTYDDASREVVAEGITDILEDSQFLQELAKKHRSVFEILKDKLKEFVDNLKSYFQTLSKNGSREAAQLKKEVGDNISYLDDIVKQFDAIAVQAVESYQKTVAEDEQESISSESERQETNETDSSKEYSAQIESKSEEKDSVTQETAENPQKSDSETASASETKYDGFSISPNEERGTLEITFDSKPSQEVRDWLKGHGFRWSSKNKLWYGKGDQQQIADGINSAILGAAASNQTPTKEENSNAETDVQGQSGSDETLREDHAGGLRESEQSGEGTPRLLDELEAGDVQQHEQAAASGDSGVGGRQAGRDGVRSDSERDGRGRSAGSGQSGDLRDGNVDSSQDTVRQSVEKQIAQKSTEKPKGTNYTIGESLNLASGEKARFSDNVSALKLIKQLETEGRYATQAEQEVLAKYVGWGGLDKAFGEMTYNRETRKREMTPKSGWEKEFRELRQLVEDGILTEEEYRGMSESTKNAHYTSMEVIRAMYDGLKQLGFQGGRMMEPSCGVGNFVGGMPSDMTATVKSWTMVELDRVTGQIAKYLYPNNDVRIEGFQDANIPDGFMDVAIGNVPFGNYGVVDRAYPNRMTKSIHNYFFAKSLDKVRNGGIVMFITSSFTMNSENNAARQYIMSKADLLGAIRLPNNAFSGNAGTEVVTDILILRKRADGLPYSGQQFLEAKEKKIPGSWRNYYVNEYFESHPEMVLGTEAVTRGMYGAETVTYNPAENAGSLGDQIRKAFGNIQEKMFYPEKTAEQSRKAAEIASRKPKNGSYRKLADGTIQNSSGNTVTDQDVSRRISGIIDIRDAYRNLVERIQQGRTQKEIAAARANLNSVYDSFVKENGYINDPKNKKAFAEDPDRFCVFSLETDYQKAEKGKKASAQKADIFTKDTIRANVTVTHADSVRDGLIVSINTTGGVDTALIAKLTGKEESSVSGELIDSRMAFKTKDGTLQAPETYLSGNVRAKLREAEALSRLDPDFQNNVEELKRVIPKDIPYDEIYVSPGAVWVPTEVYADFIAEMLGGRNNGYGGPDVQVAYSSQTGEFKIRLNNGRLKSNYQNTQEWGTSRRSFLDLMEALMGNGNVTVTDKTLDENGNERRVVNKDETAAAQEKADKIKAKFQEWIWSDETRRTELSRLYNETYNALATPKYDGSDLTVNGLNAMYSLRPHQANAVKRIIASGGNTLLAHRVGAGKTLEMAAAAMKLRELGIVKKPVFVVPKSLVAQWGVEFHNYFPAAKLLVADDKSFEKSNRKVFTNNIANGDFDAVILSYEQFGKVPMSNAFQEQFLQEQIDDVLNAIAEEKAENGKGSLTVKQMEKKVAQLKTKLEKLKIQAVDADNVDFESLGIDALFVDEAHNFKNLQYTTRMQNVGGLGNADGSQRAFDLYTKIRYLQKLNGGRGIVFATATPVMNSMAEMYIMQKYLQSDMLQQLGITTFDAWAKQFGEVKNTYEIKPSGQGVRAKQVFSNFKNLNELQLMFRSFSDVLTEVPGLKIPKMRGGSVQIVECAPGKFQQDFMKQLEKRANNVKNVDPSVDNMLKITSDGRKVSYTQRMIDPSLPYEPGCKLYRCCENILNEYRQSTGMTVETGGNQTTINGTQIVFCDMATPKGTDKSKANADTVSTDDTMDLQSARLYEDMRDYLSKNGIPKSQIAFIHEADTDGKRKQLFADMNSGKVRVLIGSTGKMGVGMNAQRCVTAIHHLDAPWRPGDVEQRDGRAFRQGNLNGEVSKYVYVTKGSFDARLWDILDRKSGFINQIMNGDDVGRNAEDTGDVTLSAAEVKALASGNPMIKESVELADELQKLNGLKRTHDSAVTRARTKLLQDTQEIAYLKSAIAARKADIGKRTDTFQEETFSMLVGNKAFTDRKSAGEALLSAILSKCKTDNSFEKIGSFAGFDILAAKSDGEFSGVLQGEMRYGFKVHINNSTLMVGQMAKTIAGLESELSKTEERLLEVTKDKAAQETLVAQPFERQQELDEKRKRYDFVMAELSKTEQQIASDDENVQNQQRTNTLTDRDVLSMAADSISVGNLTAAEADALQIFQKRLDILETLQNERAELGRTYKEQQFGENVDRKAAAQTLQKMRQMDSRIQEADQKVISAETAPALRKVLPRARKIVEQKQKEKDDATLKRWRDRRNNAAAIKKYRDQITKNVKDISDWILNPSNKNDLKHVPDALKSTVIPFLTSIDFTSKRQLSGGAATKADQRFMERLKAMEKTMKEMTGSSDLYSGYVDLPPDFMDNLSSFVSTAQEIVNQNNGQFVINQMTSQELKELSSIVTVLKKHIQDLNRFHANAVYQHVYDAGDATIAELKGYNDAKSRSKAGETVNDFIFWQQIRPAYAFERFGSGGKAIYDELRRGQSKLAFNTKEIVEFSKNAYTDEEVKAWEKEVKEVKIGGETVKMKVSQIMSFYELLKREQARGHIFGQGIRVSSFRADGKSKISDVGHRITIDEANRIIDVLTPRQIEVADKLQKYMQEKGGEWGNYVTVKRFGEKIFGEENYFPINSDGRNLETNVDEKTENASLYALLNMGFTKKLQKEANNRVVVYSIFDVFSNHMASMAQYNAMALPVLDTLKWFNYQQKEDVTVNRDDGTEKVIHQVTDSVKSQLDRVYGVPEETRPGKGNAGYAANFITGILKAFSGTETQGISSDSTGLNFLRRYNMAQVSYNLRVVIQQPLAITRAAMIIDYGSIIRGLKMPPSEIRKNIQEMQSHSGIAAWKDLGFYDTNISRGLADIIKHSETKMDQVREFGMIGAEKADQITWAAMWNACKEEVQRRYGLKAGSDGFYEAVTSLFEEVIYKTQVVDSVLTKNAFLRSKGFWARATGSFMSEPTTTASMLVDAFDKYRMDLQKPGATKRSAWEKNRRNIGRTAYVYGIGAVILAAVQAVADAFRDDDDYEKYGEKWQEAFIGNVIDELMPFNKLPVMADFYEIAKELLSRIGVDTYGNLPNSYWMQWVDSLVKGTEILYKNITNDEKNKYTYFGGIFKLLQAASGIFGFPMAAATREVVTVINNTIGAMAPSLKIKSYDPGEKGSIQYAYQDGYLTEEEAISELLSKGLAESQEDAYWTVQEWGAGVGYSRYDAINQAIRNGYDITNEMEQLTSHGYSKKDVLTQIKKNIGEWFRSGEISEEQARDMLKQYAEMKDDDISDAISRWRSYLDAGISYEEIKEKYLNGTLDARTAADMYVKYGGYSQEDADQKIRAFDFESQYGVSWDNRKEAYMEGKISAAELRKALMYVDGKTAEEADTYLAGIDFEIQHGFAYSDRQSAYINGTVSRSDMKRILIEERGYDEEDAELTLDAFDWIRDHPESDYDTNIVMSYLRPLDGLGYSAEGCGIPADTFVKARGYINTIESDKDEDGKGIAYSRINKAFPYIDSLPLTAEQKTALAVACGWSVKTVDKKKPW